MFWSPSPGSPWASASCPGGPIPSPLATIAIATLVMYEQTGLTVFAGLAWLLLTLVTLVVVYLLARTARAVAGQRICVPAP